MSAAAPFRRHPVLTTLGVLGLLVIALGLLALPFRGVQADAQAAQGDLTRAVEALKSGDTDQGFASVAEAREHVDDVTGVTHGISGTVWSVVPVAGPSIRDVRDLAGALDELTSALEVAADLEPKVSGEGSDLTDEDGVRLETLDELITGVRTIKDHVAEARASLEEVRDDDRFLGDRLAIARDDAMAQVRPVDDALRDADPLLDALPSLLGAEEERTYLVASLNPAEMKYSGGSMLSFSRITVDQGRIDRGPSRDTGSNPALFRPKNWEAVEGNPFHPPMRLEMTKANLAPSWPVSGEETLRAWEQRKGRSDDGLIVLDVVAISRLMQVTGPLQVEGVGEVTAEEVVDLTVGSYDELAEDHPQRRRLNRALIPAFLDRMFGGVDFVGTMRAMADAAHSRHLSLYFRDPELQDVATQIGFDGDLGPADHDYLGVFSQNQVGSKADYHQRKVLRHDVRLRPNGSARVTTTATIRNAGPVELAGLTLNAYIDPTLDTTLAPFLPEQAKVRTVTIADPLGERELPTETGDYYGRPFLEPRTVIEPGQEATVTVVYDLPSAAEQADDGLTYRLSIDNHPTTTPEQLTVRVRWPKGHQVGDLPEGWTAQGQRATRWQTDALDGRQRLSITATR